MISCILAPLKDPLNLAAGGAFVGLSLVSNIFPRDKLPLYTLLFISVMAFQRAFPESSNSTKRSIRVLNALSLSSFAVSVDLLASLPLSIVRTNKIRAMVLSAASVLFVSSLLTSLQKDSSSEYDRSVLAFAGLCGSFGISILLNGCLKARQVRELLL